MSISREQRVENALRSLLERLVPQEPNEDEATADQRWDEANEVAQTYIDHGASEPNVVEDVNHAADLIKRKLLRDSTGPESATAFSNLYSRLLSQPVLDQKWAILYFLLKVADGREERAHVNGNGAVQREEQGVEVDGMQDVVEDRRVYSEAFARNGLSRVPQAQNVDGPRPPAASERAVPPRPRPSQQAEEGPTEVKAVRDKQPSESALLRDLPFTLQGLSSTNLPFSNKQSLKLPPSLPVPLISLLHILAEPSLLYRSLSEFVESSDGGIVTQSLRSAIGLELRSYLALLPSSPRLEARTSESPYKEAARRSRPDFRARA